MGVGLGSEVYQFNSNFSYENRYQPVATLVLEGNWCRFLCAMIKR